MLHCIRTYICIIFNMQWWRRVTLKKKIILINYMNGDQSDRLIKGCNCKRRVLLEVICRQCLLQLMKSLVFSSLLSWAKYGFAHCNFEKDRLKDVSAWKIISANWSMDIVRTFSCRTSSKWCLSKLKNTSKEIKRP